MKRKDYKVDLFLDSGVFSAWTRELSINLEEYIAFIKEHERWISAYVALDEIPGKFNQQRTQREVEFSAERSYENLQTMKAAGLTPIPVYHQGERMKWLEQMLNDGETYVGISSAKDLREDEQRRWLDDVFTMIINVKGQPLIKTHGFGITRPPFLLRYPWFTTDSTTWSLTPSYGSILVPPYTDGKPDYLRPPARITMSGIFNEGASNQKKQFEGMGPEHRKAVEQFLKEECGGLIVTEVRYGTTLRRRCACLYYMKLSEHLKGLRFKHRRAFATFRLKREPLKIGLTVVFATNLNRQWADMMNGIGARDRLLSYWELKDKPAGVVEEYVTKGITNGKYVEGIKMKFAGRDSERYRNWRRLCLRKRIIELTGFIEP